ncbi:hypothetical protein [Kitasatospora sp. NPDC094016]|uniref:hypothetical protein n=1 Tax=Kitasatospora sp. NPDC094016 TaxID=3154986 RepID=UPI0033220BF8
MSFTGTLRGRTVFAVATAVLAGTVVATASASASTPKQPPSPIVCWSTNYHWCDMLESKDANAEMDVFWGNDGHEYIDSILNTNHYGQNLWILTWTGSGWDWLGIPATTSIGNGWYTAQDNSRSDAGKTIKIAVFNWTTNTYMYSNAH